MNEHEIFIFTMFEKRTCLHGDFEGVRFRWKRYQVGGFVERRGCLRSLKKPLLGRRGIRKAPTYF